MQKSKSLFASLLIVIGIALPTYGLADKDTAQLLDLFGDVLDRVKTDYVEEVSDKELIESAINGMLSSLDPHSSYLTEKDFDEMRIQTRGEFGGLGIEVTMENGLVKVVSPIDDTPASEAGLESGDYISRIDDEPVMGSTLGEAVEKMRGKPGADIKLEVLREGESESLEFVITRDIIKIKSVRHKVVGDVGYLRVTTFSEKTSNNLEDSIDKIKKELGGEMKGVVLDLRNNPGGLLDQAIRVSDIFLERGEIVSTGGRVADSNKRFNASGGDKLDEKIIVVMINGGSASASEIVAGALQDHKRAIVVGTKSFGKGSVQTVIPLSTSNGAMRLTTSRYYTPSGRSIQAEGIEPDIIIEPSKLETVATNKRMNEASLNKHLKNEIEKNGKKKNTDSQEIAKIYEDDYQLGRAVDLVKALSLQYQSK